MVVLHKFRVPVFKATVWVVIGTTIEKTIDFVEDKTSIVVAKEEDKKYIRAYTYAYENHRGVKKYILFFKYTAKPGEVAHEVKHLINTLFLWHGQKLSLTNDEMECYYLEDLVDKVWDSLKRYKKVNKFN